MSDSGYMMRRILDETVSKAWSVLKDLAPVFLVVAFFHLWVLGNPALELLRMLPGLVLVVAGLFFFLLGLEMALFPIGERMAFEFARKGSTLWLLLFAFFLGWSTTIAEPALTAVAAEAGKVAMEAGVIDGGEAGQARFALNLRLTVAVSVGFAVAAGVLRILLGWPIHLMIMGGYIGVVVMTIFAPREIVGIAYDAGGVTTSTVTVPLVTALGVGLAASIRRRNPLLDGFGLVALASLFPVIFVLVFGALVFAE